MSAARAWTFPGKGDASALGTVSGIALDQRGTLYILDSQLNNIQVLTSRGVSVASAGRPGVQPGELAVPRSLMLDDDGAAYVYDARTARITRYQYVERKLQYRSFINVVRSGTDACLLRDRFVVLALDSTGTLIHEYSRTGRPLRSFGSPPAVQNRLAQLTLSVGKLLCLSDANLIIVVPLVTPDIRAYTADGVEKWAARLPNYRMERVTVSDDGSVTVAPPQGGSDMTVSLVRISRKLALVQLVLQGGRSTGIDSRLVSLLNGAELGSQAGLPRILAAGESRVYCADSIGATLTSQTYSLTEP